jgi:hypothetical protein
MNHAAFGSLTVPAALMALSACTMAVSSVTTEASQAERRISGCYALSYQPLNWMARRESGTTTFVDTLLLAEDLLLPPINAVDHTSHGRPGRLLLAALGDTSWILHTDQRRYWRFDAGVLELVTSSGLGSSVTRLRPEGPRYVGLDSVQTDEIIGDEPQPIYAVVAERVACPPRLTPAT